ncbi:hypothetical protein GTQ99_19905, partial [Kineococcus sp. T13]|uniref:hypothetical protein n=1 Tax=Kineococcus vitellinus TaxID=2696565 RepID=UPI001413382B
PGSPSADPGAQVQLDQALQQARQAITDSQAALQRGDFTAYGEAQSRLQAAVDAAVAAEARLEEPAAAPAPSGAAASGAPPEGGTPGGAPTP